MQRTISPASTPSLYGIARTSGAESMIPSSFLVTFSSASRPPAVKILMPLYAAGLWLAVMAMPYFVPRRRTLNMISGVGAILSIKCTVMPLPANTSAAHTAAVSDKNRRSYPMTTPFFFSSPFMSAAIACASRHIFALMKSSPMMALQPPVPNLIMTV